MNYLDIPNEWNNSFDCIIANGSIEHFTQVKDATHGKQDEILRNFFKICHRIMKPDSRLATTVMHFTEKTDPSIIAKGLNLFLLNQMKTILQKFY